MTIANLGIAVQSGQVKEGTVDLNQFERAAKGADAAVDQLAAGSRATSAAIGQMNQVVTAEAAAQERATATTRMHAAALQAEAQASKMAGFQRRNLLFQLNDVGVSLASGMNPMMVLVQQGSQIATIYEGGVVPALRETASMAGRAAVAFAPIIGIIGVLGIGVASLTREIEQAGNKSVNFGDVALAAIQVPAKAIYDFLEPAITSVSGWWGKEMDIFADQTGKIVNFFTRNFLVGFETVKSGVSTLPDAFIVAGESAANGFIGAIEWMVQKALEGINSITGALQGLVNGMGGDFLRDKLGWDINVPNLVDPAGFKLGRADIGGRGAQARIDAEGTGLAGRTAGIMSTDYAGQAFSAIAGQAGRNATARMAKENEDAMKKAADAAQKLAEAYDDIVAGGHEFIAEKELELRSIGMTAEAANALRYEQEMLNKATNDNIKLSGAQREELSGIAQAMAAAEEAARRMTEAYDFGKDVFGGFFGDLKSGITEGKGLWESLGDAASNALDKIADRALSMAANGIFDMIFGSLMGGITGGMGGGWGVAGGFGKPGIFGIPGMAEGGTVGRAGLSWVGERGPELLRLPQGAQVIPNGPSMGMASNQNQALSIKVEVVGARGNAEIQQMVAAGVSQGLKGYDKQLPNRLQDIQMRTG